MATTTAPPRSRTPGRRPAALVVVLALAGIVVSAWPSALRVANPPDPLFCPAIWPPATSCAPGTHLLVVGAAVLLLAIAWLLADVVLRRVSTAPASAGAVAALAVVAVAAWSAVHEPQAYFAAWFELLG